MKNLTKIFTLLAFASLLNSCNSDDDYVSTEKLENANIMQNTTIIISDTVKKIPTKTSTSLTTELDTDEEDDGSKPRPCHGWECMRID